MNQKTSDEQPLSPPLKELLFSGGAGALNYQMGFSQALLEILGKDKLKEYKLGGVSAGAACACYLHSAIHSDYDVKYWYQASGRKFYEPPNKRFLGFFTNSDLIYKLSKDFYVFCKDQGMPDFNGIFHCAMTSISNFNVEKMIVDQFDDENDFANAIKSSCFIPGITSFGLYAKHKGKKVIDGGVTSGIPYKYEDSEKIFINVLPDKWPFIREVPDNTTFLNIYEEYNLHFPMDYWLWKETWADEMFLKGYLGGIKMKKEIFAAFKLNSE